MEYFKYKEFLDKLVPELKNNKVETVADLVFKKEGGTGDIDKYYNMSLPQGLIDLINSQSDEFEMYFKNSEQIVQIFHDLETKNLFLIKTNQEIEINNEEINKDYKLQMEGHERQIDALMKEKQRILSIIEDEKRQKRALDRVRSDNEIETVFAMLDAEIGKICQSLDMSKETTSIDMLKHLEMTIDKQLDEMKDFDTVLVNRYERLIIDEKKKEKKDESNKNEQLIAEEKIKRILEKTGNRRVGRPIMFRSKLNKEEKVEVKDDAIDEEEEDNIKYFT